MNIKPQNNKVIVEWVKDSKDVITGAGIVIPDFAKSGKMIEVGKVTACPKRIVDKNGDDMALEIGDTVMYLTFHPFEISEGELDSDNKKTLTISASEIIAILDENKE